MVNSGTQSNPDLYYRNGYIHVVFQDGISGNVIYRRGRLSALSIEENQNKDVLIYPNPATNLIHIEGVDGPTAYKILSLEGKELETGEVSKNNTNICVKELTPGSYILTLNKKTYSIEKQ